MKKLRLNFHLLQPHVVPFTRAPNTNSEKAKEACRLFLAHSNQRMYHTDNIEYTYIQLKKLGKLVTT
jgi:hypothetical protein